MRMPRNLILGSLLTMVFAGGALLSIDRLAALSGLSVAALSSTLMRLELKRRVVKRTDGTFEARPA